MQEGASEADLSMLPKYRYQACKDEDRVGNAAGRMVPVETSSGYMANERILSPEDAVSAFMYFVIQICIWYLVFGIPITFLFIKIYASFHEISVQKVLLVANVLPSPTRLFWDNSCFVQIIFYR